MNLYDSATLRAQVTNGCGRCRLYFDIYLAISYEMTRMFFTVISERMVLGQ